MALRASPMKLLRSESSFENFDPIFLGMPSDDVKNFLNPTCAEGAKLAIFPVGILILNDQLYFAFTDIFSPSVFFELRAARKKYLN